MSENREPIHKGIALFWCIALLGAGYWIFCLDDPSGWLIGFGYLSSMMGFGAFLELFKKRSVS